MERVPLARGHVNVTLRVAPSVVKSCTPIPKRNHPVPAEFHQTIWDESLEDDCRQLVRLAVREELDRRMDVTTVALIEPESQGRAVVVARQCGRICGLRAVALTLDEMEIGVPMDAARPGR